MFFSPVSGYSKNRILKISGLKIYSEKYIIKRLRLYRYEKGNISARKVIRSINSFYREKGYSIVRTYLLKHTGNRLSLFVDEGRLDKVVFLKLGTLELAKVKLDFDLPHDIYNTEKIKKITADMKKKYGYERIRYRLKPVKKYNSSLFQLDRSLEIPVLGKTRLPFFEKFGKRYDLEINVEKATGRKNKSRGFDYGLNIHYTKGFIPRVRYFHNSLISSGDRLESELSSGFMYGINGEFGSWPELTFAQLDNAYYFRPMIREIFTPRAKALIYRSSSARNDLGLEKYGYWLLRGSLAPGLTLRKKFNLHPGIGGESVIITDSNVDSTSQYIVSQSEIRKQTEANPFVEVESSYDFSSGNRERSSGSISSIDRIIFLKYRYYFGDNTFHEIKTGINYEFFFRSRDIYTLKFEYQIVWKQPPFYHQAPVSSSHFKGFMGKSYHTENSGSVSNEYIISIYRDYIYAGLFADLVCFKGTGYDLSGVQGGMVAGPVLKLLVFEQFEIYFYYGQDLLFSKLKTQGNVYFGLRKKW